MISASQIRAGMAIRYEGQLYKVLAADYHPGQGKMGGVNHLRLENLHTGTLWEHSLRADLKVTEAPVERQTLEYLYNDDSACFFMHPVSYEQTEIPNTLLGERVKFLEPGMQVPVEFVDSRPLSVVFPDFVEVKIADTAPPTHGQADSTWKSARLSNGVQVMVPPFVKTGDAIRLSLSDLKYMDRAKAKGS
ncbi:MAG TPA: elongation factor P [Bryobacteraceae bacterium]|jgi:elongation factor P